MKLMRIGSLFSGIGGFDLGFARAGMDCAWQVEIDEKCRDVLARHCPGVKRYEDVRDVGKWNLETVDLVCGGFPCQDLSVAGGRKGLAGERSGLWFEFIRIVEEIKPGWVVIENVAGLLSSDEGRDMGILLGGLAKCGYWWAYRVLDSQFWGVPQRRRRVFIVASLTAGCPQAVLFEPEGSPWDTPPGRETGARVAAPIKAGTPSRRNGGSDPIADEFVVDARNGTTQEGITPTLQAHHKSYSLNAMPLIARPLAHSSTQDHYDESQQTYVVGSLQSHSKRHGHAMNTQQAAEAGQLVCFDTTQITSPGNYSNPKPGSACYPLSAEAHPPTVAYTLPASSRGTGDGHGNAWNSNYVTAANNFGVRRLTPVECERLQGFPDHWTAGQADSVRYRQLGNAVTVNVVEWIGRRLLEIKHGPKRA